MEGKDGGKQYRLGCGGVWCPTKKKKFDNIMFHSSYSLVHWEKLKFNSFEIIFIKIILNESKKERG